MKKLFLLIALVLSPYFLFGQDANDSDDFKSIEVVPEIKGCKLKKTL